MARIFSLSGGGRGWWTVDDSRAGAGETFQGKRRSQYTPSANYPLSLYETIEEYASRTPRVLNPPDVIEDPLFERVRIAAKPFLKIADPLCSGVPYLVVAVGTTIADRPRRDPHERSLAHAALSRIYNGQASFCVDSSAEPQPGW